MRNLAGRVAMVTGGGNGIGRAIAERLAEEGCIVGVLDIDEAAAGETAGAISAAGGTAHAVHADIADLSAVESAVAGLEAAAGPIEVLVNNAGWDKLGRFLDSEPELWRKIIDINLWGPLNMHRAVGSRMAARGAGRIVNIASDAGRVGSSGEAVYAACKGGVIAFSKSLARELAGKHININVVCPGPTETALFNAFLDEGEYGRKVHEALQRAIPFRRFGQPDDIAGIVAFLASDDAGFITGQVISVSGGLTMHG
jgi:2-hydroxycyclohexanecarboxyl-CoA dehydrogenase